MRFLTGVVCLLIPVAAAFAQSDRGTITGTVTDSAGAVIADATIQARQTETGATFDTTSTATGNYTLAQLPVGPYEVTATVSGFKKFVRSGITVEVAQVLRIDIQMEIGSATESVTITAEASLLKTESGDVSSNVQVSTLDQLPMLSVGSAAAGSSGIRNPNNVLNVVPGVYYVPNSQIRINGAQTNSYAYRVEGMDSTNIGFPYAAAQTQPSVDAIQEVAVQTSNFAPEFGQSGGGFFNVTMKSGTNQFHGSAYDYFVNEVLNAGVPFSYANPNPKGPDAGLYRPAARRNDYGFTIGGPVFIPKVYNGKDRTFFFFNFEQFRETQEVPFVDTVPTAAYRAGNFSGALLNPLTGPGGTTTDPLGNPLITNTIYNPATRRVVNGVTVADPFPNNTIPMSQMDPVALRIQSLIPLPTNAGNINNYTTTQPSVRHTTIPAVKGDQLIGAKQKISFYWSFTHTDSQYSQIYGNYEGFPLPITNARGTFIHSHVERLNYDYTVSPTLLAHVGAGYQQNNFFDDAPVLNYNAQTSLGLTGSTLNRNFPIFNGFCPALVGCTAAGGLYGSAGALGPPIQGHSYWEKPTVNASLTQVKQNHTFKYGTDMYWSAVPQIPYTNTAGAYTFSANETAFPSLVGVPLSGGSLGFPYASFLLGEVDAYNIAAVPDFRQAKKQVGFYAQDSWKVTRNLTLTYGVRYDFGTYYREEHGRAVDFSFTAPNSVVAGHPGAFLYEGSGPGACNCSFANNYPYALGPRVGLAYSINDKTVVRAGWGFIYGTTSVNGGGALTAGIVNTQTVGSPGLGLPATTLSQGITTVPTFPSNTLPLLPIGNQALPAGLSFVDPNLGRPPRQDQWSIGIEREILRDLAADVSYVANRGVWWQAPGMVDINAVTNQILASHGFNLADPATQTLLFGGTGVTSLLSTALSAVNPAVAAQYHLGLPYPGFAPSNTVAQSLRPFPQFGNIPVLGPPLGKTWYDSLQARLTKRLTHGLTVNSTFTWQKSLQLGTTGGAGQEGNGNASVPNGPGGLATAYVNNVVNAPLAAKSISGFDQPFLFTLAASYSLPRVQKLGFAKYVFQDWQIGTLLNYSSGLPIPVPASTTAISTQLFQPTYMNRVSGVPLYLVSDLNCHCFDPSTTPVLNPAAWTNPAPGQFSSATPYYADYRYARHPIENINAGRTWVIKERFSLNLRVEWANFLNRTYIPNPTSTNPTVQVTRNKLGNLNGGFGYISTAFLPTSQLAQPRNGTIVMKVTF
ncbi:MAG: TonB-dependent receptor [Acidobacteriia bacterium]|nr:TonB-dependent receptor [Terriglobia bacterium]